MSDLEVKNATIRSTSLGYEDHGILTCWLHLDYDGSGQGFGGYALDRYSKEAQRRFGTRYGLQWIIEILRVLEVDTWEQLPGTPIRVRAEHSKVHAIGHYLKEQWFDPSTLPKDE